MKGKHRSLCAAVILVAVGISLSFVHASPGGSARPDILVVTLDDDTFYRLRYLNGDPGSGAPETLAQAFRANGIHWVNFLRSYATTPLCCPSRASFLTAQYAHRTGVLYNEQSSPGALDGGAEAFTQRGLDQSTIATWLHAVGYRTCLIGKYLNGYELVTNRPPGFVPPGWDDWHALYSSLTSRYRNIRLSDGGVIRLYPYDESTGANYSTDVYRDKTIDAIRGTAPDQPLFIYLAPSAPHGPAVPAARHANRRSTLAMPRPPANPAFMEEDISDKPTWIQSRNFPAPQDRVDYLDALYRDGANCLSSVSEALVAIIHALASAGRLERTVLFITNDNGWTFLDHRTYRKGNPYEPCARVSLIVASANHQLIPQSGGRQGLVANIDLAPTIAELAGAPIPVEHPIDGASFASMLRSPGAVTRSDVLLEFFRFDDRPGRFRQPSFAGLVTGPNAAFPGWKYIEYANGEKELYDLAADRYELTNVVTDPGNAALIQALASRIAELRN